MLVPPPMRVMHALAVLCALVWPVLDALQGGGWDAALVAWPALAAWIVVRRAALRETRKLPARYADAFARSDADALAEVRRLYGYLYADSVVADAIMHALAGTELLVRKQWGDARDELAKVERRVLPKEVDVISLNNLAYATARAGDAARGVILVESALEQARHVETDAMKRSLPSLHGTHGIALHLAGRHEDALPILEEVAQADGIDRLRNERLYWLGCAYRAVGRDDDAHAAFSRAADIEGPCRDDARAELAGRTPFRR